MEIILKYVAISLDKNLFHVFMCFAAKSPFPEEVALHASQFYFSQVLTCDIFVGL